jgi:hypothetical protein
MARFQFGVPEVDADLDEEDLDKIVAFGRGKIGKEGLAVLDTKSIDAESLSLTMGARRMNFVDTV